MPPETATLPLRPNLAHAAADPAARRNSIDLSIVPPGDELQPAADAAFSALIDSLRSVAGTDSLSELIKALKAAAGPSALIDISVVAATLNVSVKTGRRLNDSGRLPKPIRLGRVIRWRRDEIMRWIEAGCPNRDRWEALNAKRK